MERPRQKGDDPSKFYIDIYNLPEHGNKEDIVFFLWKALEKCKALNKHTNPINRSQAVDELGCIRLFFRSREEILNCLDLNGIFYGERSFYMKSPLASRTIPQINPGNGLNIRRFNHHVEDSFNKLCISNLPEMKEYQIVNFLTTVGELKAFQPVFNNKTLTHCFFEYLKIESTQSCLTKLNNQKIKSKTVSIKRAALMSDNTAKTAIGKPKSKSMLFEKDLHSHFLTFDTVGFFKTMKISCVLLLKNIISSQSEKELIKEDIRKEVQKIGCLIKIVSKEKNVYIEYERVEYAQICYLLLMNRKFDGKNIDVSFYDPLNFADDILI